MPSRRCAIEPNALRRRWTRLGNVPSLKTSSQRCSGAGRARGQGNGDVELRDLEREAERRKARKVLGHTCLCWQLANDEVPLEANAVDGHALRDHVLHHGVDGI